MFFWRIIPKNYRALILDTFPVHERESIKRTLSGNARLPKFFEAYKCLYVHVPKCAGTSITDALFSGLTVRHLPYRYYESIFPEFCASAFKFAFVRHPVSRAFSAFKYCKYVDKRDMKTFELFQKYPDFESFVQEWLSPENAVRVRAFAPQFSFLCNSVGDIRLDFIGRFESLEEDFHKVRRSLQLERALQKLNASVNLSRDAPEPSRVMLSQPTIDILARVYEQDFKIFGYDPQDHSVL